MACKKGAALADSADKGREGGRTVIVLTESVWILWIWQTEVVSKG